MSINADNFANNGIETGETETSRTFLSERTRDAGMWYDSAASFNDRYSLGGANYNPNNLGGLLAAMSAFIAITESELGQFRSTRQINAGDQRYAAVIQAGGAVNVNAGNGLTSSVVRPGYTYVGAGPRTDTQAPANTFSTRVTLNSQLPPDLAQQQVNPITLPGFTLPIGQNGLFRLSGQGSRTPATTGPQSWALGTSRLGPAGKMGTDLFSDPSATLKASMEGDFRYAQDWTYCFTKLPAPCSTTRS